MIDAQKVSVCTRVYNTKPYLAQCVTSVLSQTYKNIEYIIVDNGCTDGSKELLEEFAAKDKRIKLYRFEENRVAPLEFQMLLSHASGKYFTILDSDDWWESDYLERLVLLMEENNLDIVCTGTVMHHMETGKETYRKVEQKIIFPKLNFADGLPWYHGFFRTTWGKVIRLDLMDGFDINTFPQLAYGGDTWFCFQFLRRASCIGIDNSILHHYRLHQKSSSFQYDSERFQSDIYLYNDAIDFLTALGPVSDQNQKFLYCVYANAVFDTLGVIEKSALTPQEKLQEYTKIATHPITLAAYRKSVHDSITRSHTYLLYLTLQAGSALKAQNNNNLHTVMQALLPRCGCVISMQNLPLILQDKSLFRILQADEPEPLLQDILERIAKNQGVKKYNLVDMLQALTVDKLLLNQITDTAFLRRYGNIYLMVWREEYYEALEEMTGLLLEGQVDRGKKVFLELYISLAAILSEGSAFIFGKLQMASLLLKQGDLTGCRDVVADLDEMGVAGSEELDEIKAELKKQK